MKYTTKEQIHGIQFYHEDNKDILYTINSFIAKDKIRVEWNNNKLNVFYSLEDVISNLNSTLWKVVFQPNNEPIYEIY